MTTQNRFKFTDTAVGNLAVEPGRRKSYRDTMLPSLELRVTGPTKIFYVCKWHQTNNVRIRLGDYPSIRVATARRLAQKALLELASGVNPNSSKRSIREQMTLGELFEECLRTDFKPYLKSWKEYQAIYNRYLSRWRTRPLTAITRQNVQSLHSEIGEANGPYSANRAIAVLSLMFNKAITRGFAGPNPVKGITKFRERSRERFLHSDELPRFFRAVAAERNEMVRDYVLLSLLTGARRSNVLSMRWDNLNLERGHWSIAETKNGSGQCIVLVPMALEILRRRASNHSEWVFPSDSQAGHFKDPKRGWERIVKSAGLEDLRIHDLRRSLGSWQAATGASLSIIGKSLNHRCISSTTIYARLSLDPVRASIETATNAMLKAAGVGEVFSFPKERKAS